MSVEAAVFLGETAVKAVGWLKKRRREAEIYVLDMFYSPGVLVPRRWRFDEDNFGQGMPLKVVNHSNNKHYTISFFQFQTTYRENSKIENLEHQAISVRDKQDRGLAPNTSKEFALPWKLVESDAEIARVIQTRTGVKDFRFSLFFHDDYDNKDYPRHPKALYPFRIRSEASRALGKFKP